jgi:hypothetical protein
MTTILAHFDGKSFVPDEPVTLPPQQRVTLHIDPLPSRPSADADRRPESLMAILKSMEQKAIECDTPEADFSRDSIYPGTLDDPR